MVLPSLSAVTLGLTERVTSLTLRALPRPQRCQPGRGCWPSRRGRGLLGLGADDLAVGQLVGGVGGDHGRLEGEARTNRTTLALFSARATPTLRSPAGC